LAVTADSHIVEGFLTGGESHDVAVAQQLLGDVVGCKVLADRGYDSNSFRSFLIGGNCDPVIPGRKNRKEKIEYDKVLYKKRGLIERIFGKIKENRRLAMRFEKSDNVFMAFIATAFINTII